MKSTLKIDVTSFYESKFKRLKWSLKDQTEDETVNSTDKESITNNDEVRNAIEDHLDHIRAALPPDHELNDYEVTLSFSTDVRDEQKAEFTEIFNEFNTSDESN